MTLQSLESLLFVCLIVNLAIYLVTVTITLGLRDTVRKTQSKIMGISEDTSGMIIYAYIGAFKLLIIVFNLTPWIALQFIQ